MKIYIRKILYFSIAAVLCVIVFKAVSGEFMFSSKKRANKITVESAVIYQDDIGHYFAAGDLPLTGLKSQRVAKEARADKSSQKCFLFVRMKTEGSFAAWGQVSCRIGQRKKEMKITIPGIGGSDWYYYLIDVSGTPLNLDSESPDVHISWDKLFTKG